MIPIGSPQPTYKVPPAQSIPDIDEDQPIPGKPLTTLDDHSLPPLVYGAAPLSTIYNSQDVLESPTLFRAVRLALRYGINSFDTSPYYGASEIILGQILQAQRKEFPRESYTIITKCGRYGAKKEDFDYSPATIRKSVQRSLERLGTDYLDGVYLHDVEFVATPVHPVPNSGQHNVLLDDPTLAAQWGLVEGDEGKIHGPGDQVVLDAFAELRKLQEEGVIKSIGISGYPLPTLLRLALLILHTTGKPVDIILSYSHYNLQNSAFAKYLPVFTSRAKVARFLTGSPFSMGLLTNSPPAWHPAPAELHDLIKRIRESEDVKSWPPSGIPNLALGASFRMENVVPNVVGFSTLKEVHESVAVWREIQGEFPQSQRRKEIEEKIRRQLDEAGWIDKSWGSGG